MKRFKNINLKFSIKKQLNELIQFFKKNLVKLIAFFVLTVMSSFLVSFGINSSTKATIDSVAITAANIAKDNSYEKVHFESKLTYFNDESFSKNSEKNTKIFTEAHRMANQSFLKYSSAAFLTRNNFYNTPITNSDNSSCVLFEYSFLESVFSLKNITPSTNSEIVKKYTTTKYVDGILDNNYSMTKLRMETIDLFLLFKEEKSAAGYPMYLPDYVAQKIVEENESINSLKDCLGLAGTINVSGVKTTVYIKNIIASSARIADQKDINDCDFTENNVRFAKFLKQLYGDYSLMFFSPMYSQNRCMTCADFDSEYFKIKSYLENDLTEIYSKKSSSSIYGFEKEDQAFKLKENKTYSSLLTGTIQKRIDNAKYSYFDGDLIPLIIGIVLFFGALLFLFVVFSLKKFTEEELNKSFLVSSFIPFIFLNLFLLLFCFFFSSKQAFISYVFSSLSIVIVGFFLIEFLASIIIFLFRRIK